MTTAEAEIEGVGKRPYVAATQALLSRLDPTPLGMTMRAEHRFDPTRLASERFLDRLEQLDALRYGPLGMKAPRWALYDCAALPGVIAGFGAWQGALPHADEHAFEPLSMAVATPLLGEGRWLLSRMSTRHEPLFATLALTFALVGARRVTVTAGWRSGDLDALAAFAPLEVRAAWLPAHDHPATGVLELHVDPARLALKPPAVVAPPSGAQALDTGDDRALQQLQHAIEAGARARVVGPPAATGGAPIVPITIEEAP